MRKKKKKCTIKIQNRLGFEKTTLTTSYYYFYYHYFYVHAPASCISIKNLDRLFYVYFFKNEMMAKIAALHSGCFHYFCKLSLINLQSTCFSQYGTDGVVVCTPPFHSHDPRSNPGHRTTKTPWKFV